MCGLFAKPLSGKPRGLRSPLDASYSTRLSFSAAPAMAVDDAEAQGPLCVSSAGRCIWV